MYVNLTYVYLFTSTVNTLHCKMDNAHKHSFS